MIPSVLLVGNFVKNLPSSCPNCYQGLELPETAHFQDHSCDDHASADEDHFVGTQ